MPIYEYQCPDCGDVFSHLWRTVAAADEAAASATTPACPTCGAEQTERIISQVAVLGSLGGLTPTEQAGVRAEEERKISFQSHADIKKLQAARQKKNEAKYGEQLYQKPKKDSK